VIVMNRLTCVQEVTGLNLDEGLAILNCS